MDELAVQIAILPAMRTFLRAALALTAVAVTAAVVVSVAAQQRQAPPPQEDKRFEVQITDEMVRHSRIRDVLYFVGTAWGIGIMALLLITPASRKIRDTAARV